jgi:hypothetical protein
MKTTAPVILGVFCLAVPAGCDRPQPPRSATAPSPPSSQPAPDSARKTIQLGIYPLTADVPKTWEILNTASVTFLQGPSPNGDLEGMAILQISNPPSVTGLVADKIVGDAQALREKPEHGTLQVEVRTDGLVRIIDKRSVADPADGKEPFVSWSLDVLVSGAQERIVLYHLNFVALARHVYEKDRAFLESIVSTVRYDPKLAAEAQHPEKTLP